MRTAMRRRQWMMSASSVFALSAMSYSRLFGASERLRVASIGTGGKGWSDLTSVAHSPAVDIVALCNVDQSQEHFGMAVERFPQARQYVDWRKLLDDSKDIDAIIVSTPDFMHAPIALPSLHSGKHVFCEKPLTHTVFEARQMRLAAEKFGCVTQMGNQIQSHSSYRTAVQWVHEGAIGKVTDVYSWQASDTKWPRSPIRPQGSDPIPPHLHWDLWNGVAPECSYKTGVYHDFNWRGWKDFGTGMLGDFGCHILDPVFMALALTAPVSVEAEGPAVSNDTWPNRTIVRYVFPATPYTANSPLKVTWYDGIGVMPDRALCKHLPDDFKLPNAGSWLVGDKGSLLIPHVSTPALFPTEQYSKQDASKVDSVDHYVQWADACRGVGHTTSHFGYAGRLTEAVLLGTVAQQLPGQRLAWDSDKLAVTNSTKAQELLTKSYRRGWEPVWIQ